MLGNFDVQIDYMLSTWPAGMGHEWELAPPGAMVVQRISEVFSSGSPDDDAYVFWSGSLIVVRPTPHSSGGLRLARDGSTLAGYFWDPTIGWVKFGEGPVSTGGFHVSIEVWNDNKFFDDHLAAVDVRNVNVSADDFLRGPPGSVRPCRMEGRPAQR